MVNWEQWNSGRSSGAQTGVPPAKSPIPPVKPAIPSAKPGPVSGAGGSQIEVDKGITKTAAKALKDVGGDMNKTAKNIADLSTLVKDHSFKGDCFSKLDNVLVQGHADFANLADVVANHGDKVESAVDSFVMTDEELAKGIQ